MTKEEILEHKSLRIVFSTIEEAEKIVEVLGKYNLPLARTLGILQETQRKMMLDYLKDEGQAYISIDRRKILVFSGINYIEEGDIDIQYNEFLMGMGEITLQEQSSEFCMCSSPRLKKVFAGEWFDFCEVCKKERK